MRVLLVGGSKSGKSSLAQRLALRLAAGGPCVYWATMEPADGEDDERIKKHILDREGLGFLTLERGRDITGAALPVGASVLFDSVTALLANEMFGGGFDPGAAARAARDIITVSRACRDFICVADEVYRDGADLGETTEAYRRGLALICRELAAEFDSIAEVVCGITNTVKGELPEC